MKNPTGPSNVSAEITTTDSTTARQVTPTNPLYITSTPAKFDNVEIVGGQIYTQVSNAIVTFDILTKTS